LWSRERFGIYYSQKEEKIMPLKKSAWLDTILYPTGQVRKSEFLGFRLETQTISAYAAR
jgi:hypothetical protein